MAPFKVLIVGGGITGPALAFWLSKINCDITIVERSPDLRASGQQIDLRGEGVTVMRSMGIEAAVRAKVVDERGTQFVNQSGRTRAFFEANKTGTGRQGLTSEFEIMRGDLVRILYDLVRDKCTYRFGTTVEDFQQHGDRVHVRFSDGKEDDFDLLVGADGQGSRTRRRLLGPGAPDPFEFFKLYMCYFTVPQAETDTNRGTVCLFPGRRMGMTRVDNPKTLQVYLSVLDKESKLVDLEEATRTNNVQAQKKIWSEVFRDSGWELPRFLDGMMNSPYADDFFGQKIGQVKMDKWSKGRVILLGDAAYCASPLSGKGTSIGLVGAYVLAGELSKHLPRSNNGFQNSSTTSSTSTSAKPGMLRAGDIDHALESFEKILRPFIAEAQKLIPGVPGIVYAEKKWGVWIRYLLFGLVSKLRIHKLLERFSSDDIGSNWELPHYPELRN